MGHPARPRAEKCIENKKEPAVIEIDPNSLPPRSYIATRWHDGQDTMIHLGHETRALKGNK